MLSFLVKIEFTPILVTVFGIIKFSIISTLYKALSKIFVTFSVKISVLTFEFVPATLKIEIVLSPIAITSFPAQVEGTINTSYG